MESTGGFLETQVVIHAQTCQPRKFTCLRAQCLIRVSLCSHGCWRAPGAVLNLQFPPFLETGLTAGAPSVNSLARGWSFRGGQPPHR